MSIIFNKLPVIVVFLSLLSIKLGYSLFATTESNDLRLIRLLSILVAGCLAFFSFKKNWICGKVLAAFILVSGISSMVLFFAVGTDQLALKVLFLILGAYFFIGGFKLFRTENKQMAS